MRGVQLQQYGDEEQLHFTLSFKKSQLIEADHILIQVKSCAISKLDIDVRLGKLETSGFAPTKNTPSLLGYEISGTIVEIGDQVASDLVVGDHVVGLCKASGGGYAEFTSQPYYQFVRKPSIVEFQEAAGALLPGIRAYNSLYYKMRIHSGESILIMNGASEFGHIALQLASLWGANVFTTISSAEEFNYLHDISANIVRIIDTRNENITQVIAQETDHIGVDYILDDYHGVYQSSKQPNLSSAGASSSSTTDSLLDLDDFRMTPTQNVSSLPPSYLSCIEAIQCLSMHGSWVCSRQVELDPVLSRALLAKNASISFLFDASFIVAPLQTGRFLHILSDLMKKIATEQIQVKLTTQLPLEKIRQAHRSVITNKLGRTVIKFSK